MNFGASPSKLTRPISVEVYGLAGKPLTLIARDETGNVARADSTMPLAVAQKQPLTTERLRDQLGRLGGTPFVLRNLTAQIEGRPMLPFSVLGGLRKNCGSLRTFLHPSVNKPPTWFLRSANRSFPGLVQQRAHRGGAGQGPPRRRDARGSRAHRLKKQGWQTGI